MELENAQSNSSWGHRCSVHAVAHTQVHVGRWPAHAASSRSLYNCINKHSAASACVGGRGRTEPVEEVLHADHIHLVPDIAHAVSRNSSGTRPESLEVVEADSDRKSQ